MSLVLWETVIYPLSGSKVACPTYSTDDLRTLFAVVWLSLSVQSTVNFAIKSFGATTMVSVLHKMSLCRYVAKDSPCLYVDKPPSHSVSQLHVAYEVAMSLSRKKVENRILIWFVCLKPFLSCGGRIWPQRLQRLISKSFTKVTYVGFLDNHSCISW
jgi:hypothetical protein